MNSQDSPPTISDLNESILSIIAVKSYIAAYTLPENRFAYDISYLRKQVKDYNKNHHASSERNIGGSSSFHSKLEPLSLDGLYLLYNNLREKNLSYALRKAVANLTQKDLPADRIYDEDWQWRKVKEYSFCRNFLNRTFPFIHPFTLTIVADTKEGTEFQDIPAFEQSHTLIRSCSVTLDENPKVSEIDSIPAGTIAKTEAEVFSAKPYVTLPHTDYIAHYLSLEDKPVIAYVRLKWNGYDLIEAKFIQLVGFAKKMKPYGFTSATGGIRRPHNKKSYSITLETDKTIDNSPLAFLHISIENEPTRPSYLTGVFSSFTSGTDDMPDEPTSFGGGVILQPVTQDFNASKFSTDLADWKTFQKPPKAIEEFAYYQLIQDGWAIRYRLLSKITKLSAGIKGDHENNWTDLRRYVGAYTCYYMRLSKRPVMFETSLIDIKPDGTCILLQEKKETSGYVKVHGNRLWFYFGYHLETEKEPIRFLVDDANANNNKERKRVEKLFGIFHSHTIENSLVAGRMMMVPLYEDFEYLSTPYTELTKSHINADAVDFFTGIKDTQTHLTDGPYWAEVANRISGNSAIDIIADLGAKLANRFYYYTFKKDSTDEEFIIERNIIEFLPNNVVKVYATNSVYIGTAYYHKSTLKLSLIDEKMGYGFLEIFLEYDIARTSETKILHGITLWRSSNRLQGKAVVLSRCQPVESGNPVIRRFDFTPEGREKLEKEDAQGAGVISHLRGEFNRYLDISTKSSPLAFRPRDKTFREMHFLLACHYGYALFRKKEKMDDVTIISHCKRHLLLAYRHGYGCNFAGLAVDLEDNGEDRGLDFIEMQYKKHFSIKGITTNQFDEIKLRLRQIAKERGFMTRAFAEKGPLSNPDIRNFAQEYWPWL